MARLRSRRACVQVCEFSIDTSHLRHTDVDSLGHPEAFMSRYSQFWGGVPDHGLDAYDLCDRLHTQALNDYGLTRSRAPLDLWICHPSVRTK